MYGQRQLSYARFGLTQRELEVITCIEQAMTNKDIAVRLSISVFTVKHHLQSIFDKCGVSTRLELYQFARHHKLTENQQFELQLQ